MKHIYLHILVALALTVALTLPACDKEDTLPPAVRDYPTFSASIDGSHTRATDDYWENGDKIGITGGEWINISHVIQANDTLRVEKPEEQIYFQDAEPVAFTAYYPYNSDRNVSTGLISITTANQANQKNFDFLWADGEGSKKNPTVTFNFTHQMSKVTFVFKNGKNTDVSSINKIRLNGLVVEGTFDTTTGECAVSTTTSGGSATLNLTDVQADQPVTPLILFPQKAESVKLEIYDSGSQYYVCNLTVPDSEFSAGYNYTYTITVNKTGLQVTGATISDWTTEVHDVDASSGDN